MYYRHMWWLCNMDGEIVRSIMKSRLRVSILRYLWNKYPDKTYLSEITRGIHSDPSNTRGALVGFLPGRWDTELSLVSIGLVKKVQEKKHTYYLLNGDKIQDIQDILTLVNNKTLEVMVE